MGFTVKNKTMSSVKAEEPQLSFNEILTKASNSALRGGLAGACAMGANVACLMWMRTTINFQYRNGTTFPVALRTLYADGGIPRFYRAYFLHFYKDHSHVLVTQLLIQVYSPYWIIWMLQKIWLLVSRQLQRLL